MFWVLCWSLELLYLCFCHFCISMDDLGMQVPVSLFVHLLVCFLKSTLASILNEEEPGPGIFSSHLSIIFWLLYS